MDFKFSDKRILLASNSPRRRELLKLIVPDFGIAEMHDIDETYPVDMAPERVPLFLSQIKADAYSKQLVPNEVIITADTVVIDGGRILGKPHCEDEAIEMIHSLLGHTHKVTTGVTLTSLVDKDSFAETTEVTFGHLSDDEIRQYVTNYRPFDKAGAYGIQEWIGAAAIVGIKGCFYNVMGLPLHALYTHLRTLSI